MTCIANSRNVLHPLHFIHHIYVRHALARMAEDVSLLAANRLVSVPFRGSCWICGFLDASRRVEYVSVIIELESEDGGRL